MLKSIIADPKQTKLAEDLKKQYFILTDRFWSDEETKECEKGFADIEMAETDCDGDDTGIGCTALRSFQKVRSAMLTTRKNLTLLREEALERGQKATSNGINALLNLASGK